jgi:hypothetical protein
MSYLNPAKRQRALGTGGDVYSQQISADVVPGPEPRFYTTYLKGTQGEDQGAHGEIALFQEMRTTNLVPRTSAYQVAVEKACVDTKALPSFIAQVDQGNSNPSGDINQLQSQVGFEMNWSGSLFPSTLNGSTIAVDTSTLSSTTPSLYSFLSTGGSSLPIKYSRSSYGVGLSPFDLKKTPPAVEGTLQAYIENNPNSPYWQRQYNFNLDIQIFLISFNKALVRAFGMWEPTAPNYGWTLTPTATQDGSTYDQGLWSFICTYSGSKVTLDLSQVLISNASNAAGADPGYGDLYDMIQDFYPNFITEYTGGLNAIVIPCSAKQSLFLTNYKKENGQPPAFRATLYAANPTYGSVPVVSMAGGTTTQTLPSSTQIAVPTPSNVVNADNMATLAFTITTLPTGDAASVTVPSFDFYQGISATKVQCSDTSVTLQNQVMGPLYVNSQPSRSDYVTSAYLLGFEPDTVFNLVQTSQTVFANRPLAPAFSTRIDLSAYQPLIWKPSDAYTDSAKPQPGSAYYYGYGTSYYLDNVVNPGIANCFQNQFDDYFTGDLPSTIMEKLILFPNINAITDLSLNGQLYCTTYFNSSSAPIQALRDIKAWKAGDTYAPGTPVTFVNSDPSSPINNLYIANVKTGSIDFQPPVPFKNSDFWLYCGPFIYSSAVVGAKYMDGELVTHKGYASRVTGSNNATGGTISISNGIVYHTFTSGSSTFTPLVPLINAKVLVVGGGGGGGQGFFGGGGGAGAVTQNNLPITGPITVTVGAGGAGTGVSGSTSSCGSLTASGGGGGGNDGASGQNGASGGGGSRTGSAGTGGGAGIGNAGGAGGGASAYNGGGGGGFTSVGGLGGVSTGGTGGTGIIVNVFAKTYTVAGGGGGGANPTSSPPSTGGIGSSGGGNGGSTGTGATGPTSALPNSGSGGGGCGGGPLGPNLGGEGGSGLVVIAYPLLKQAITFTGLFGTPMTLVPRSGKVEQVATGGDYFVSNGYAFHVFTEPGSASLNLLPGTTSLTCSVLTVGGGGGGGGQSVGGGGGAASVTVAANVVTSGGTVVVGAGGTGGYGTPAVVATGGTIQQHGDYTWHIFTSADSGTDFVLSSPDSLDVQYLMVGGGGGGGGNTNGAGGGGGGGAVDTGNITLTSGSFPVTVGTGGDAGQDGGATTWNGISVLGGGYGGLYTGADGTDGNGGGCGGGGGGSVGGSTGGSGGASTHNGGAGPGIGGAGFSGSGGGGGGWDGDGATENQIGTGANGGAPVATLLNGISTPISLSGGGGGGGETAGGTGGNYVLNGTTYYLGGNGGIGTSSTAATAGTQNTGSGGGGAGNYNNSQGAAGSGGTLVIIYRSNPEVTARGTQGGSSSFQSVSAIGGGGGGGGAGAGATSIADGGTGGNGGGGGAGGDAAGAGGASTSSPVNNSGGAGYIGDVNTGTVRGGGGGGFGGAGSDGITSGAGGTGYNFTFPGGLAFSVAGGGGGGSGDGLPAGSGASGGGDGGLSGIAGYPASYYEFSGWGSGGGGCGSDPLLVNDLYGGDGAPGLVVISYPLQDYVFFGQYNMLKPTPVVGTAPLRMTINVKPGDHGDVFEIEADTYGFGTYDSKYPRDPILAYARDSWGCLQSNATSFITNRIYDEYLQFSCNTSFRDMFRGFSATAEKYVNQLSGQTSTYWLHDFILSPADSFKPIMPPSWYDAQVMNDGITQSSLKYLPPRMVSNATASTTSPAFLRNSDAQVYYWTITSSETSRYSMWDPVQSLLIEGNTVPVSADNLPTSGPVTTQIQSLSGDTRLILAEFFPKMNPAEGTTFYEPQFPRQIYLATGTELKYFSYRIGWRNKFTGEVIPLVLSSNGSAMVVFMFTPKN